MHGLEVFGCILTCQEHDAGCAPRVLVQVSGAIVDFVLHDNPSTLLSGMLLNLLFRNAVLEPVVDVSACRQCRACSRCCLRWSIWCNCCGFLGKNGSLLLTRPNCCSWPVWCYATWAGIDLCGQLCAKFTSIRSHPACQLCSRDSRVLKPQRRVAIAVLDGVYLDTEDAVVHHPHDIPSEFSRLESLVRVHHPAANLLALQEARDLYFGLPPCPAPVFVCGSGLSNLVLRPRQLCQLPGLASIK
mmetsp:Transcript_71074/g.132951  ORF Transcript_71074/g.132951 Transcript_71074/m.132951 type:complete len:244 (+) Transcript_71074:1030-1761(+)